MQDNIFRWGGGDPRCPTVWHLKHFKAFYLKSQELISCTTPNFHTVTFKAYPNIRRENTGIDFLYNRVFKQDFPKEPSKLLFFSPEMFLKKCWGLPDQYLWQTYQLEGKKCIIIIIFHAFKFHKGLFVVVIYIMRGVYMYSMWLGKGVGKYFGGSIFSEKSGIVNWNLKGIKMFGIEYWDLFLVQ